MKQILKTGIDGGDLAKWTKAERRAYNDMVRYDGTFEYVGLGVMLKKVFEARGEVKKSLRRAVHAAANFYTIGSSFVHGSQGTFYDIFEQSAETGQWETHFRSLRLTEMHVLHETIFYMILAIFAESLHRQKDLGADMYWRELDLNSGEWSSAI